MARLRSEAAGGLVDPDILDILVSLNGCGVLVTTSSCSGRIALIAAPRPGDKRHGGVVASWHRRVSLSEILDALQAAPWAGYVWVSVQPPMLNMYACRLEHALTVARLFARVGFKYASVRPTRTGHPLVHVASTERIDVPLVFRGKTIVKPSEELIELLNSYLVMGKAKLESMRRVSSALLASLCGDEDATLP